MQRLRLFLTMSMVLMLLLSVAPVLAQTSPRDRDGDGVFDRIDGCPDEPGPASNSGCPVPVIVDNDMDGVSDDIDFCLDNPGPLENGGCPLSPGELPDTVDSAQPDAELAPLPVLPITGPCEIATQGYAPVNIRHMPWSTSIAVGAMDPYTLYPLIYYFDNPYDELWYGIAGGHAASWVTRIGGLCDGIPTFSFAENENAGEAEITLKFHADLTPLLVWPGFNPDPPPPDGPEFPDDIFPFPLPDPAPIREHVLLARFGPNDVDPQAILIGLLLPAVQAAREAANETGETQNVLLTLPGSWDWFNPQPEPPPWEIPDLGDIDPPTDGPGLFLMPGTELMFNPQPEPPAAPFLYVGIKIEPVDQAGDEPQTFPTEMVALNLTGGGMPQACDGSVMPTAEQPCLYTSSTGEIAVCMVGPDMATYCMYGSAGLPAVQ